MHLSNYISKWKLETNQDPKKKWFASGHMRNIEIYGQTTKPMKTYTSYGKMEGVRNFNSEMTLINYWTTLVIPIQYYVSLSFGHLI